MLAKARSNKLLCDVFNPGTFVFKNFIQIIQFCSLASHTIEENRNIFKRVFSGLLLKVLQFHGIKME